MSENLREIWENAYFSEGDKTFGVISSYYDNHDYLADYSIDNGSLIVDIGKDYFDDEEEEIGLVEIEYIIRDSFEDLGLNEDSEIKFNFLK
ncbi:hypothetical protein [Chryseobacterium fistulae]|uniref:Uncharacterized protein n=1 Tax=Chryseobacterium fistulae TaxID=2675058 RepID=A0A6N4XUJ0_9FLAO|nr:hypothetical protein [Chryseobacterium fistulae]CAA7386960.1 hypothetical protein CHRY9393_01261 [Chryseobacterium fistulae]